jgi:hypothetical protein
LRIDATVHGSKPPWLASVAGAVGIVLAHHHTFSPHRGIIIINRI